MATWPSSPTGARAGAAVPRHVVLVGLSGSGKSTVGAIAASRLAAPFVDLDARIEQRAGRTIARIFAEDGEAAFRTLEVAAADEVLSGPPSIVAAGGGYFDNAAARRRTLAGALVVYHETAPTIAASRLGPQAGRPLLEGVEPAQRLVEMLERRGHAYHEAHQRVTTDGQTAAQVADQVVALAREKAGW